MNSSQFKSAGAGVLIVETVFTTAVLMAEPPAEDLASLWAPADKGIRAAQQAVLAANDKVVMTEAASESASYHGREAMSALWMDTRKEVGNDAQAPLMKKVFPAGLTGVKKLSPQPLCDDVQRVLLTLQEPGIAAALTAHIKPLQEIVKRFEKPLAAEKAARLAESHVAGKWVEAREGWIGSRVALFGALTQRFPNKPGYVSSFFRPAAPVRKPKPPKTQETAPAKDAAAPQKVAA
jgi:hypothetical protein